MIGTVSVCIWEDGYLTSHRAIWGTRADLRVLGLLCSHKQCYSYAKVRTDGLKEGSAVDCLG